MNRSRMKRASVGVAVWIWAAGWAAAQDGTFKLATWNVENYRIEANESRKEKPDESRGLVVSTLLDINADVVALQEIGSKAALGELRERLLEGGSDYPHWELVSGSDTNIHVAVISRFPIVNRVAHNKNQFLLMGKRFGVSRGFCEVSVQINPDYRFDVLVAHLKSRLEIRDADQEQLRRKEAGVLREIVSAKLSQNADLNLAVVGDLNDTKGSESLRLLRGRGKNGLWDSRPGERNFDGIATPGATWTHHYAAEDAYDRIDYILLSGGMKEEFQEAESYVYSAPRLDVASDHRPVVATFVAHER